MTYKSYRKDMKRLRGVPMSEKAFNLMQGIEEAPKAEILSRAHDDIGGRYLEANLTNHIKITKGKL